MKTKTTKTPPFETQIQSKNRRSLLLSSAGSAALLTAWHEPMIKSIVLPAHAVMSSRGLAQEFYYGEDLTAEVASLRKRNFSPLDLVVQPAMATVGTNYETVRAVLEEDGYTVEVFSNGIFRTEEGLQVGDSPKVLPSKNCLEVVDMTAQIISAGELHMVLIVDECEIVVPFGTGDKIETPDCPE